MMGVGLGEPQPTRDEESAVGFRWMRWQPLDASMGCDVDRSIDS